MLTVSRARPVRRGMTLIELLISLVLLGIVGGTLTVVLFRQQRFHAAATAVRSARESVREVATILPADLRGVSQPAAGFSVVERHSCPFSCDVGTTVVTIGGGR